MEILELDELTEQVLDCFADRLPGAITLANRTGNLRQMLELLEMDDLLPPEGVLDTFSTGTILVIGDSTVSRSKLEEVVRGLGLNLRRFEFVIDYDSASNYKFSSLEYNGSYRAILCGPIAHSTEGRGSDSSIIEKMINNPSVYARTLRLESNSGELKITKDSFKRALAMLVEEGYL